MLTDATLRNLKPKDKGYKFADRDGLYVFVLTSATISFRYNYAINGRQETLVIGRYGPGASKLSEGLNQAYRLWIRPPSRSTTSLAE